MFWEVIFVDKLDLVVVVLSIYYNYRISKKNCESDKTVLINL